MADDMSNAEFAALEFMPWPGQPDMAAYGKGLNDHIVSVRLSYLTMFKNKDELVEFAKDESELFMKLADNMGDSVEAFKEMAALCQAAQSRMLVAAAAWVEAMP